MPDHKLTVGQQLWFVCADRHNRYSSDHFVTINKIGRKWADIGDGYRCDIETLVADGRGFASPGRCYLTKADHDERLRVDKEWNRLECYIHRCYGAPPGITLAQIIDAQRALGIAPTPTEEIA